MYYSDTVSVETTLFMECPSSQLLHCPTTRLDKQQGKESTKVPKNLQSAPYGPWRRENKRFKDLKTYYLKPTAFLEGPKTCSIFGGSRDPVLPPDARSLIAGGEGVSLRAHEGCVLPGGKFFIAIAWQSFHQR